MFLSRKAFSCEPHGMTLACLHRPQVQEHPGSHEEFGSRLAALLHNAVRQEVQVAADAAAGGGQESTEAKEGVQRVQRAAAPQPVLWTTVIRGCVQVVLWGWVPGEVGDMDEAAVAESLLRRLARSLPQAGTAGGGGGMRSVSLQVGQAVAQLDDRGSGTAQHAGAEGQELSGRQQQQQTGLRKVLPFHGLQSDAGSGTARLLQVTPPAASVGALVASGSVLVRLLLHSPAPQPARVLVLAETGGEIQEEQQAHFRTRLLRELTLELVGGPEEVELVLGAGELEGAVGADGVGVLQLVLVGPEHGASGQRQGPAVPPLVHWVAPPLLLLPDAAAQELCGLWERMKGEEEGQGGEEGEPGSSTPPAGQPAGAWEALAGTERQSSLWWSHLAPLLGDLAYVLAVGAPQGQAGEATGADPVLQGLFPFLQENEMSATAALVEASWVDCGAPQTQCAKQSVPCSTTPSPDAAASFSQASPALPGTSGSSCKPTAKAFGSSAKPPATSCKESTASATAAAAAAAPPSLLPLLPWPFIPPSLELSYQSWRLVGLAAHAPYVLAFCLLVYATMVARILLAVWTEDSGWGAAMLSLWARLVQMTAITTLTTLANAAGQAVLHVLVPARSRQQHERQKQQGRLQRVQERGKGATSTMGGCAPMALLGPGDILAYRLAACGAGPTAFLLCGGLLSAHVMQVDAHMVGNVLLVYASSLIRAVAIPCLQQMSAVEALAAAPLLGAGEALLLLAMQPGWGLWRAAAVAVAWRLVAVCVSAAWEQRSRWRFMQGQQQEQQ